MPKNKPKEVAKEIPKYFLCLFKVEGHATWRSIMVPTLEKVDDQLKNQTGKNKITERKVFVIDRTAGTLEEIK